MKRLRVTNFGPIREADVKFGDLTVLVGPQASGKSLFLQLYKLIVDAPAISAALARYGFDLRHTDTDDSVVALASLYFGGGLEGIFSKATQILCDARRVDPVRLAQSQARAGTKAATERVFLIPAQRVIVLQDGWPKPFMAYGAGDPYAIRQFSESIRMLMERLGQLSIKLLISESEVRRVVDAAIYRGSTLEVKREGMRRQIVLKPSNNASSLPYNVWSAGQREFTPLRLGFSAFFMFTGGDARTVIFEEPEMGLHPQAIIAMGLLVLDLLEQDFRVMISTHSPVVLDLIWAIRELSKLDIDTAVTSLYKIFHLEKPNHTLRKFMADALTKSYCIYFFNRTDSGVIVQDISTLDPGAEDENIAGWGGLSGFSGRIARIVGEAGSP